MSAQVSGVQLVRSPSHCKTAPSHGMAPPDLLGHHRSSQLIIWRAAGIDAARRRLISLAAEYEERRERKKGIRYRGV
jgi:hypothetical protein